MSCFSISAFSANQSENEVLIARSSPFQVKSVENLDRNSDKWIIKMALTFMDVQDVGLIDWPTIFENVMNLREDEIATKKHNSK